LRQLILLAGKLIQIRPELLRLRTKDEARRIAANIAKLPKSVYRKP
jgi:hypothetical protein